MRSGRDCSALLDDRDRINFAMTAVMQASMAAQGLLAIGVAVVLVRWRRLSEAVFWSLAIGGAVLLDPVLKELFRRDAIGSGGEWSFASGTRWCPRRSSPLPSSSSRARRG